MIAWIGGPRDERLTLDLVFSKKTKGHDLVFSKKTKGHDPTGSGFLQKKQKAMIQLDLVFSKKTKNHDRMDRGAAR